MNPTQNSQDSSLPEVKDVQIKESAAEPRYEAEKELFLWTAPSRPFKRRNREFYITTIVIALIVGLVLFFTEGFMPVILLISLVFLYYVLSTVEPDRIEYKITNKGIYIAGKKTEIENFKRFWFSKRYDSQLLVLETYSLPGRLEYVINSENKEEIKNILAKYLAEEEVPPSGLDKATNWFAKKLPGNKS